MEANRQKQQNRVTRITLLLCGEEKRQMHHMVVFKKEESQTLKNFLDLFQLKIFCFLYTHYNAITSDLAFAVK